MSLEEKVLDCLKQFPNGLRLWNIASSLGVWQCNLISTMAILEKQGKVIEIAVNDPANMEFYIIFKIKE